MGEVVEFTSNRVVGVAGKGITSRSSVISSWGVDGSGSLSKLACYAQRKGRMTVCLLQSAPENHKRAIFWPVCLDMLRNCWVKKPT
jgi:hypothetical protein